MVEEGLAVLSKQEEGEDLPDSGYESPEVVSVKREMVDVSLVGEGGEMDWMEDVKEG